LFYLNKHSSSIADSINVMDGGILKANANLIYDFITLEFQLTATL